MRRKGTVKFYSVERGFGFIAPDDGSADCYLPKSGLPPGESTLSSGLAVTFRASRPRGSLRPVALDVRGIGTAEDRLERDTPFFTPSEHEHA
jgi:CspA family cold shock protein